MAGLAPAIANAAPSADVVIVWAPGAQVAPIADAARQAGAAVIDRSPAASAPLDTSRLVNSGIAAYDGVQFAEAAKRFDEAKAAIDRTGAGELSQTQLADLFLYRGLLALQEGNSTAAWDELVTSVIVAPGRVLDPARFPPSVRVELERVRIALTERERATLAVTAPPGCTVFVDGAPVATAPYFVGPHWASARCPDRKPWGTRIQLTADMTLAAGNAVLAAPNPDEMLIQARTAGARAFIYVEVANGIAVIRLIGIDGRERDRKTASTTSGLASAAAAVRALLTPEPIVGPTPWYKSRWLWAAGAAMIVAAIAIPVTAAVSQEDPPTDFTLDLGDQWNK